MLGVLAGSFLGVGAGREGGGREGARHIAGGRAASAVTEASVRNNKQMRVNK